MHIDSDVVNLDGERKLRVGCHLQESRIDAHNRLRRAAAGATATSSTATVIAAKRKMVFLTGPRIWLPKSIIVYITLFHQYCGDFAQIAF